ncbi:MAG: glycosyltransferase family 2 protein [Symploca sp. SIO2G7]|nr:glycosyltransferase family 2 protein [Symploca sp. SIO2G7]
MPSISIVVPVHNGGESFRQCLAGLDRARFTFDELIVVADGDTDGSWRIAEQWGARVIRLPQAGGPARARNRGAQIAKGDVLFFVDADVYVPPEAVKQVADTFKQEPELAALIGSYDDAPGASNFLSQYRNLLHHYTHQTACADASTFWGACGAIRRDVFMAIEGFDESYRYPSIEDIELGYRLKSHGYHIRLDRRIQVKHLKYWQAKSMLKADFFYRALPWTELILRKSGLINDLNLKTSSRISVVLAYASIVLFIFSLAGALNGHISGLVLAVVCLTAVAALFSINLPVYRFFWRKRGKRFAARVVPWHCLYYLYSGLAFAIGWLRYRMRLSS